MYVWKGACVCSIFIETKPLNVWATLSIDKHTVLFDLKQKKNKRFMMYSKHVLLCNVTSWLGG